MTLKSVFCEKNAQKNQIPAIEICAPKHKSSRHALLSAGPFRTIPKHYISHFDGSQRPSLEHPLTNGSQSHSDPLPTRSPPRHNPPPPVLPQLPGSWRCSTRPPTSTATSTPRPWPSTSTGASTRVWRPTCPPKAASVGALIHQSRRCKQSNPKH